ncbi:hypothetical protein [Aquimarina algiphila]|uniref:hypothetical protein n=1 Tax=Aquimarina algiphila TaxID=2047982 RepID=UPI00248FA4A6|nr:hypothetical protein [Aquimarina algiphila]
MSIILFFIIVAVIGIFPVKWVLKKLGVHNNTTKWILGIPLALILSVLLYMLLLIILYNYEEGTGNMDLF